MKRYTVGISPIEPQKNDPYTIPFFFSDLEEAIRYAKFFVDQGLNVIILQEDEEE